ncbi:hypothetical protein FIU97_16810 [Roseivivax sp. THAF40]|uniref:DUF2062 domain-containing protein n=1 Tax=unclassified Roseivivax TaxID=2639302 RepID=UPI0012693A24|nr:MULTISPECIES: DUF2062 domain-containing protein [unclassified Roseivivax]QFS84418.1 hypothetical protein FIV09_16395 [Roseivivax sp. THAF197b]QFT48246.1 hypothetical protein FIU97_16810 [Roseivivax sp. THAF40]
MVFRRRDQQPLWKRLLRTLWPKGGWGRAAQYIRHRLQRLPDPPDRIARGIFAGVFMTFTPLYGLHFFLAALLAWILRGNIVAALLGTFFGNPLTYVPIAVISLQTGNWLLGVESDPEDHRWVGQKFTAAGRDLWDNMVAIFTPAEADWQNLSEFYAEVFYPYLVGGIIPGIITGLVCYYISLPLIRAYQNRRKGRLAAKLALLKAKKKSKGANSQASAD